MLLSYIGCIVSFVYWVVIRLGLGTSGMCYNLLYDLMLNANIFCVYDLINVQQHVGDWNTLLWNWDHERVKSFCYCSGKTFTFNWSKTIRGILVFTLSWSERGTFLYVSLPTDSYWLLLGQTYYLLFLKRWICRNKICLYSGSDRSWYLKN